MLIVYDGVIIRFHSTCSTFDRSSQYVRARQATRNNKIIIFLPIKPEIVISERRVGGLCKEGFLVPAPSANPTSPGRRPIALWGFVSHNLNLNLITIHFIFIPRPQR
jgi:hypothetical protein